MKSYLPVIYTDRLILREVDQCDAYDMYEYAHLPFVGPSAGWEPHTNINHTREIINLFQQKKNYGQLGVYSIVLKENSKMIGTCELHTYTPNFKAELGYTINPNYWGNGYALEASKAMLDWGFNKLNLKRIECLAFIDNKQSSKVCEKLGLTYEGIRKKAYQLYDGSIGDLRCYAITDDEYYGK